MSDTIFETKRGKYLLPVDHGKSMNIDLVKRGFLYEKGVFDWVVSKIEKDMNVIDVGLCVGQFCIELSKHVKSLGNGVVYAFEANPDLYKYVQKNIELNECDNIKLFNRIVWNESNLYLHFQDEDVNTFPKDQFSIGTLSIDKTCKSRHIVETYKLDDLVVDNVCVIKIDAQGADLNIMKGAYNLIMKHRPAIAFEIENCPYLDNFGCKPKDYFDFVEKIGYKVEKEIGLGNFFIVPS